MNLFENLQILSESESHKKYQYVGKVYKNDMKSKIELGEIKTPIYAVGKSLGVAYHNFINDIVTKNQLFNIANMIQIDKENIKEIDNIPENPENIMATLESSYGMERYSYVGPVYRFDRVFDNIKEPIYTIAKSYEAAARNFCYKLKNKYNLVPGTNLTIDKDKIERDTEIEEKTKQFEKEPEEIVTKVDDPKFNFDDPDRDEEYVVESIMSFDDWLDKNFNELVKDYAELYEMEESEVYNEDEDFEEYVNDQYEEYYRNTNRYIDDESLKEDFEVSDTNQKYTSANTSINSSKLPAIFKMINLSAGTINLDFGGGRFDNVAEFYKDKDVINLVYDPYNRSSEHNSDVLNQIKKNGGADSVTCSNVLNVIAEPEARETVIKNIYNLAKSGAPCYFTVYEGSGSGEGSETKAGYQLNKKTADYLEEIQAIFPNAKRKGKLIVATK